MTKERKVILYIAASLDGYIAKPNDDLSFLSFVEKEGEDYGYADFIKTVDTVILGRKTYDWIMKQVPEFVHGDKVTYVITRTKRPSIENTKFYTGDIKDLINRLKREPGNNIFIDGGAQIVTELLKLKLIDEFIISIIPVMVGDGIRLFQNQIPELYLKLHDVRHFDTGLVQLHYKHAGI
ncbi:MAG: dihydrofolate reductase family protein [Paludibacter sp.]|nr:dihydrofolate reductase family protein [Paludibacter sp.]